MSRKFLTPIVLPADPTVALEAATKQYVDGKTSSSGSEVEISATDPIGANPAAEIWIDTASSPGGTSLAPRGYVADAMASVAQVGIANTATDITGCTVTFTAEANRRYRTTLHCGQLLQKAAQGVIIVEIADAASGVIRSGRLQLASGGAGTYIVIAVETGLSGTTTRKATVRTTAGTVDTVVGSVVAPQITVEDIGGV